MRPHPFQCTLLVTIMLAAVAHSEDWTQWRGPHRANRSMEKGLFRDWGAEGPKLDWIAEGLGGGYARVSVAGALAKCDQLRSGLRLRSWYTLASPIARAS